MAAAVHVKRRLRRHAAFQHVDRGRAIPLRTYYCWAPGAPIFSHPPFYFSAPSHNNTVDAAATAANPPTLTPTFFFFITLKPRLE